MAPLIVQIIATLLARLRSPWLDAVRMGLATMSSLLTRWRKWAAWDLSPC